MLTQNFLRVVLPCIGETNKYNVGPVVFSGDISITQKAKGNRCTLTLGKSDYALQEDRFISGSADDDEEHMFVGHFRLRQVPACRIDTDKGDDESIALASTCPLARLSSTFTEIRLVVRHNSMRWKQDVGSVTNTPKVLRGQLVHLCTGHSPANIWDQPPLILETPTQAALAPASSVAASGTLALPIHQAKGKGTEVDTPIESEPVTVPASERLKTFAQKADEKRKAAKAAAEEEIAAMESKHSAEKAEMEREHAEMLQSLDDDIAAEEDDLRFQVVQFEEGS